MLTKLDIPSISQEMQEKPKAMHGKRVTGVTYKAMNVLKTLQCRCNVRELKHLIERGIILRP